jgi:hypothetical protein
VFVEPRPARWHLRIGGPHISRFFRARPSCSGRNIRGGDFGAEALGTSPGLLNFPSAFERPLRALGEGVARSLTTYYTQYNTSLLAMLPLGTLYGISTFRSVDCYTHRTVSECEHNHNPVEGMK